MDCRGAALLCPDVRRATATMTSPRRYWIAGSGAALKVALSSLEGRSSRRSSTGQVGSRPTPGDEEASMIDAMESLLVAGQRRKEVRDDYPARSLAAVTVWSVLIDAVRDATEPGNTPSGTCQGL